MAAGACPVQVRDSLRRIISVWGLRLDGLGFREGSGDLVLAQQIIGVVQIRPVRGSTSRAMTPLISSWWRAHRSPCAFSGV